MIRILSIPFMPFGLLKCAALACALALAGNAASAASLTVSPIGLTVPAPDSSSRMVVRNENPRPVTVQVRVFKWAVNGTQDSYIETRDVVVSPPMATINSRGELHVRVLRVSKAPVRGEESYRIVVDEVPDANRVRNIGVNIALRYTLPLFFLDPSASQPRVTWSIRQQGKQRLLIASNAGDKHLRIADLAIGKVSIRKGLAGYVLGRSTRAFVLPPRAPSSGAITAVTRQGRMNASLTR